MTTLQDSDFEEVDLPAGRFDWQRWANALVGLAIVIVCFLAGFMLNQRTVKPTGAAVTPVQPTAQAMPTVQVFTPATMPTATATPKTYQPVDNMPGSASLIGFMVNDKLLTCAEVAIPEVWQGLSDNDQAMIREMCGGVTR